jgi:hypothetical protein
MKRVIFRLFCPSFLILLVFCDLVLAEIWLCQFINVDGRWYTSNPVNSDKQKCVLRDEIGESRFTKAAFHRIDKSPAKESTSADSQQKQANKIPSSSKSDKLFEKKEKYIVDWIVEELRPQGQRRGDIYSTSWCKIVGNVYGEGPRLLRMQIRRGGAKVDEVTVYLSGSKSRATWRAKLKGRCRNLNVR